MSVSGCTGFSTCRIQFIPNNRPNADRNYSDRSIVELRQHDFANYSVRTLDIENKNEEIFNVPLEREDQYRRGKTNTFPDEIRTRAGVYRLWLNAASRTSFHEALNLAFQEIQLLNPDPSLNSDPSHFTTASLDVTPITRTHQDVHKSEPNPPYGGQGTSLYPPLEREGVKSDSRYDDKGTPSNPPSTHRQTKPDSRHDDQELRSNSPPTYRQTKPNSRHDDQGTPSNPSPTHRQTKPDSRYDDQEQRSNPPLKSQEKKTSSRHDDQETNLSTQSIRNGFVTDVYQLGQHIRQGDVDSAVNLATKLSKNHVRLQANLRKEQNEENSKSIRVRIDSNDPKISRQYNDELVIDVYPSTTIGELRTAFEYSHEFPPSIQHFFVNGHLAHEISTMNDLNITPDSLFVLFLIQQ